MKFGELQSLVGDETIFRSSLLMTGQYTPADVRRQMARWVRSGKVLTLRRGVYSLAAPSARRQLHPFTIANELRRSSYISLQSALAHYGMIPEFVPAITSVTTERPEQVETPLGRFLFRHVKKDLFYGVHSLEICPGQFVRMATMEKALIDLLYLTSGSDDPDYLDELRIEPPEDMKMDDLMRLAVRAGSGKVMRGIKRLERTWREDRKNVVEL